MDQDLVVPNTALLDDDIADLPPPETIPDEDLEETLDEESIEPPSDELIEDDPTPSQPITSTSNSSHIPEVVRKFFVSFYKTVTDRRDHDMMLHYDSNFGKLTETYFKDTPWPSPESVSTIFHGDEFSMLLYKELFYRHLYDRLHPSGEHRLNAWRTYVQLFTYFQNAKENEITLPKHWLWDILNSFVVQAIDEKNKYTSKDEKENAQVWNIVASLNYLQGFITKTRVISFLNNKKDGENLSIFSRHLGFFSIVGLVHFHACLGDHYLALKTLSSFDLTLHKELFVHIPSCYVTLNYYLGFVYVMHRRFVDAGKTFASILYYIYARSKQQTTRSFHYDQVVSQKIDKLFSLLAICISLCPQRIDESVHLDLREKCADKIQRMQKGDMDCFSDLFSSAAPKFISPFDRYTSLLPQQRKIFLNEIKQQELLPAIRSFLKLYVTITPQKLAGFLDVDEKRIRTQLLCYKHKTRSLQHTTGSASQGEWLSSSDVDFVIDHDMLNISDNSKVARRFPDFFVRKLAKMAENL